MAYVLGLNAYHADAAACLVKDGTLVAAVEEERFRRVKHWGGFPSESIRYCLAEAGIALGDVEHVAVNSDNRANRWRKLAYVLTSGVGPGYVLDRLRQRGDRADVAGNLKRHLPEQEFRGTVHAVEHHLCHLASAFLVSPYDKAVAVSVDGFGDFSSAAWGLGEGGTLTVDGRVYFPHSLGVFYEAMTQFIGFPHYGDEYKVMGLAPYGEPRYVEPMKQIVKLKDDGTFALDLRYFRHAAGEGANYQVKDGIPSGGRLWSDAPRLLGPRAIRRRRWKIASATSRVRRRSPTKTPSSISCRRCTGVMAPTRSCWRAAAPTTRWPTARCSSARRSRSSTSSRRAATPAARSVRLSPPGTGWAARPPSATS
jgi:carbamoyltransferase